MSRPRLSAKTIYLVVSQNGCLCNFADSQEVAKEMTAECAYGHEEPHRVVIYERSVGSRGRTLIVSLEAALDVAETALRDLLALAGEEWPSAGEGPTGDVYWPDIAPRLARARAALAALRPETEKPT